MAYKYITAGQAIQVSPKQDYTELFQQNISEQFYNSTDWYTISEETSLGSGVYANIDVRINDVISSKTGEKVSDDYKLLLFENINHSTGLGRMYQFDNNYWLTVDVDKTKTLATTATIKRCNNVLRWQDENGAIYNVPCSINYLIKMNRDYSTAGSALVTPAGMIEVKTQFNISTNKIKPNQRFLFGNSNNWLAYRVEGGGIEHFNNLETLNNTSPGLIFFSMETDYVNEETDDITNGIADVVKNSYILTLNQSSISGDISQEVQLEAIVTLNEKIVNRTLTWSSNNSDIASVDNSGLVTFVAEGSAIITCSLFDNSNVKDTCSVTVESLPVDNYQLLFSPVSNYILEGNNQIYDVYLYKNGIQQSDIVSFSLNPNSIPSSKYSFTIIGDNSFEIVNLGMFLTDQLEVTASSGIYSIVISISLRGAW